MKKIIWQIVHFVGLSGIGWILDFSTYTILGLVSDNLIVNNFISSLLGVTFVFIFATRKIFQNNSKISLKIKYFIYIFYQLVLILLVSKLLDGINSTIIFVSTYKLIKKYSKIISKICITPITMILNYMVMKGIIEKL